MILWPIEFPRNPATGADLSPDCNHALHLLTDDLEFGTALNLVGKEPKSPFHGQATTYSGDDQSPEGPLS
jgi:hypothetical protein